MATFDHRIFRAYDIRGKAGTQVTPALCCAVGVAFGTILRERTEKESPQISVGRDARISGPELEHALIEGLLQSGCSVLSIGQTPSPLNCFTMCTRQLDGGIQVTASHNPAEDNGLKLCTEHARAFAGEDIQLLRRRCEEQSTGKVKVKDAKKLSIEHIYTAFLLERFHAVGRGLSVVIDAGNGVAGPLYTKVLRAVGCAVTELYTEPDGRFPN
ncbi:phosphomannomutase/phosphoglucomutase, partial [Candidatus Peregrinibacteria bacterium]|nr:phosphomannomutase/phosphoglucomutase [Candidatus Peregrinibacteria bacterium]